MHSLHHDDKHDFCELKIGFESASTYHEVFSNLSTNSEIIFFTNSRLMSLWRIAGAAKMVYVSNSTLEIASALLYFKGINIKNFVK
jgi:hypothetical protein